MFDLRVMSLTSYRAAAGYAAIQSEWRQRLSWHARLCDLAQRRTDRR